MIPDTRFCSTGILPTQADGKQAFPGFGAQPPNSEANSRLDADGSGLPERITVDETGGLEAAEAAVNSACVAVVVRRW